MAIPANYRNFKSSFENTAPPSDWPIALKSLWFAGKGDWEASHNIAQDMHSDLGSWIHAYLHRQEGDEFNARYWYNRAGKSFPEISLAEEHQEITKYVLS